MWQVNELIPFVPTTAEPAAPRLFFTIYYTAVDHAFKRAALTWLKEIKGRHAFGGADLEVATEVGTEQAFVSAWNDVAAAARKAKASVYAGNLLTHASKQSGRGDGLEFKGGTLTHHEIVGLPRLPWSKRGFLILSGCNTGLILDRAWAPAHSFALSQGVPTVGQAGFSYFSNVWRRYSVTTPADASIALWAYARGQNSLFGSGNRTAGIVYKP
jgi:hypothetical protein